jgi:hypothetical protein
VQSQEKEAAAVRDENLSRRLAVSYAATGSMARPFYQALLLSLRILRFMPFGLGNLFSMG